MSEMGLVSRVSPVQIGSVSACKIVCRQTSNGTHQKHCCSAHPMSLVGQNPKLPQRNNGGRFTSINRHNR
jgi:hypothetical protein